MLINRNIWSLFYVIFVAGILLFVLLSYTKYKDIQEEYHLKYVYFTGMIAQASHSRFIQDEFMLEILGTQLLKDDQYKDQVKSTRLFDQLLQKNPTLAGFGFADAQGDFFAGSSNIKLSKMPNLLQNKRTKYSFQEALKSDNMVLGRTYYVKTLDQWVIPLRKSIRDEEGNVLGVLTTGLILDNKNSFLNKISLPDTSVIALVKDFNQEKKMYRQFANRIDVESLSHQEIYDVPVPYEIYETIAGTIKEKYDLSMEDLKETGKTVSFEVVDQWDRNLLMSLTYDKTYKLWVLVQTDFSVVTKTIIYSLLLYLLIFVFSFIVIYGLFKYIAKLDKTKRDELLFQIRHDSLTQLPNRDYLYHHWTDWILRLSNNFDMLFIDLDNFKNINDGFGHKFGDAILIEVAKRLSSFFAKESLVVRQGGDEFIVLMQCKDEQNKEKVLSELIELISQPYQIDNMEFSIGASLGTAQYPKDAKSLETLMSLADTAMYEAKKRKNAFCVFSSEMQNETILKVDIEHELRNAIKSDELWMVYQPQINRDGTLHGVEALVRWKNEKLGFVPPDKFISVAEETGLMPQLGDFIIKRSLEDIQALQVEMNRSFQLSINISVRQLIEVDFLQKLLKAFESCDFDRSRVTIEITENLFIEDIDYILPLLIAVKEEGIKLSLDDFGTGYSSLSMLRKLPINELKIDKSFVDVILHTNEDNAMVNSIIKMGQNLRMATLAEGVETEEQAELLRHFGCDIFQGYFFAKPLSKDELRAFLKASAH
jgi:diguanylate cyclase (GGDEF)-like protein